MPRFPTHRLITVVALAALTAASCAQINARLDTLPRLDEEDLGATLAQSTKIFDSDGRLITTLHGPENRTLIASLKRIPKHVRQAVIAIEDERFYEHNGVDLKAIVRAALSNATSGRIKEGGSTITQQYVKNVIIAPGETAEKTIDRKIEEAALSRQVEERLSKNELLLRYLNTVYFGNGAYGVQAAARTYFGKPVWKVSLDEAATLAGLIRAPQTYDPYDNAATALQRRNTVIQKMADLDYVDEARARKAMAKEFRLERNVRQPRYPAPYFVDYVQRLLTFDDRFDVIGKTVAQRTKSLFQGGLRIHTTVDLDTQAAAETAIDQILTQPNDPHGALVAIEPDTGHVRAMVGGRDWFASRKTDPFAKVNLAIAAEPGLGSKREGGTAAGTGRQAGSAFKPFALAAAIDEGIPLSKQYDARACMDFPGANAGGNWHVCNYESQDFGKRVSLLEATVKSINVVYAQLILDVGAENVVATAREMGITTPLAPVESAVLGTNAVNPLGMASAYGTLATTGKHTPPVAITEITTAGGKVIYRDKTESEQVLSPAVAHITTTALQHVMQRGTGVNAQIPRPAAGKTGTAQEWRDAWFAGYTPDLVASVWVGYPEGEIEMKLSCAGSAQRCKPTRVLGTGGTWPAMIWGAFMERALAGVPAAPFPIPALDLVTREIDIRTGCLAGKLTPEEFRAPATFQKGTEPEKRSKEECRVPKDGVKVPDVLGFPVDAATRTLENEGFVPVVQRKATKEFPPGVIMDQSPVRGRRAAKGSEVLLIVSARASPGDSEKPEERDTVTVPDVLGMTRSEAEGVLKDHGFEVDVIIQRESNKERARHRRDRVWKQSPPAGTEAGRGSTVTIWVNPD